MEITMAWTETARRQYERRNSRYASDLTDAEWSVLEPLMPLPRPLGRPRKTILREGHCYFNESADVTCSLAHLSCGFQARDFAPHVSGGLS